MHPTATRQWGPICALGEGRVPGRTGRDDDSSAIGNRIARIKDQVCEDLLQLAGIAVDLRFSTHSLDVDYTELLPEFFRLMAGALPLGAWAENAVLDWTLFGAAIALALLAAPRHAFPCGLATNDRRGHGLFPR